MLFRQEGSCFSTVDQSNPEQVNLNAALEIQDDTFAIQAIFSKDDLGWLEADCPTLPPEEDEVCADNPDPPEVPARMVVVVVVMVVKNVMVMLW